MIIVQRIRLQQNRILIPSKKLNQILEILYMCMFTPKIKYRRYTLSCPLRGVVGRVTAFHTGNRGSIPGRIRNFNSHIRSGTGSTQPREDN